MFFQDSPWVGYGPGTYGLQSRKAREAFGMETGFAHNAFLQTFAESGMVVGILFFILMFSLLFVAVNEILKKKSSFDLALLMGVVSLFLDALVDFDWSFISIFSLMLIFLAIIIRNAQLKVGIAWSSSILNAGYFFSTFFVVMMLSLFILVESFLAVGKVNTAFQVFPYLPFHLKVFDYTSTLNQKNKEKMYQIYFWTPLFYESYLPLASISSAENKQAFCQIDPLSCLEQYQYSEDENWMSEEIFAQSIKKVDIMPGSVKKELAQQALFFALLSFEKARYQKSGEYFSLAQKLDPWILSEDVFPDLSHENLAIENLTELLSSMRSVPGDYYDENWEIFSQSYRRLLAEELKKTKVDVQEIDFLISKILEIAPWVGKEMKAEAVSLQVLADEKTKSGLDQEAQSLLTIMKKIDKGDYFQLSQLANFYAFKNRDEEAKAEFDLCMEVFESSPQVQSHDGCYWGKVKLENGDFERDTYWKVSEIIRHQI